MQLNVCSCLSHTVTVTRLKQLKYFNKQYQKVHLAVEEKVTEMQMDTGWLKMYLTFKIRIKIKNAREREKNILMESARDSDLWPKMYLAFKIQN